MEDTTKKWWTSLSGSQQNGTQSIPGLPGTTIPIGSKPSGVGTTDSVAFQTTPIKTPPVTMYTYKPAAPDINTTNMPTSYQSTVDAKLANRGTVAPTSYQSTVDAKLSNRMIAPAPDEVTKTPSFTQADLDAMYNLKPGEQAPDKVAGNITQEYLDSIYNLKPGEQAPDKVAANLDQSGFRVKEPPVTKDEGIEPYIKTSLDLLKDYATGNSEVDRIIANRYLARFDASSQSAMMKAAQQDASNPYLPEGTRNAARAILQRDVASQRSEMVGEMAQNAQQRAYEATGQLGNLAVNVGNMNIARDTLSLAEEKFADDKLWNGFNEALSVGDLDSAANIFKEATGETLNTSDAKAWQDLRLRLGQVGLDEEEYNVSKMIETGAGASLAAYFMTMDEPEYDWRSDPHAITKLSDYYAAVFGPDTPFDPSNTEHQAWADSQYSIANESFAADKIQEFKISPAYTEASPRLRDFYDNVYIPTMAMMLSFPVDMQIREDADHNLVMTYPDGTLVPTFTTGIEGVDVSAYVPGPAGIERTTTYDFNDNGIKTFIGAFNLNEDLGQTTEYGMSDGAARQWAKGHMNTDGTFNMPESAEAWDEWCTTERVYDSNDYTDIESAEHYLDTLNLDVPYDTTLTMQYLAEHDGKLPANKLDFKTWAMQTGSIDNINYAIGGNDLNLMEQNDRELLGKIATAQRILPTINTLLATGRPEDRAVALGFLKSEGYDCTLDTMDETIEQIKTSASMGDNIFSSPVNIDINNVDRWNPGQSIEHENSFEFQCTSEFADTIKQNAGNTIVFNHETYIIDPEQPIAVGRIKSNIYDMDSISTGAYVMDLETGTRYVIAYVNGSMKLMTPSLTNTPNIVG